MPTAYVTHRAAGRSGYCSNGSHVRCNGVHGAGRSLHAPYKHVCKCWCHDGPRTVRYNKADTVKRAP